MEKGQPISQEKECVRMWSRGELKGKAKEVLRGSYWKALLVSVVIAFAVGGGGSGNGTRVNNKDYRSIRGWYHNGGLKSGIPKFKGSVDTTLLPRIGIIAGIIFLTVIIFVIGIRIFVGYHLEVGGRRYFIQSSQGDVNLSYLDHGFEKGRYLDIIKAMIWKDIFNFLWFLVLIIPGFVKFYAYSMVPYILADNPNIGYRRALELSKKMTDGEKWDMWVLDLSFIGWYLLGALVLGLGGFFVLPYDNATHSELYLALRYKAIKNGICDHRELKLVRELKQGTEIY